MPFDPPITPGETLKSVSPGEYQRRDWTAVPSRWKADLASALLKATPGLFALSHVPSKLRLESYGLKAT